MGRLTEIRILQTTPKPCISRLTAHPLTRWTAGTKPKQALFMGKMSVIKQMSVALWPALRTLRNSGGTYGWRRAKIV